MRRFEASLRAYERALYADNARARSIRALEWADSEALSARENARWARLRAFVLTVLDGRVPDPCKRATHFGARYGVDAERAGRAISAGRWALAVCSRKTANAFFREVRR